MQNNKSAEQRSEAAAKKSAESLRDSGARWNPTHHWL